MSVGSQDSWTATTAQAHVASPAWQTFAARTANSGRIQGVRRDRSSTDIAFEVRAQRQEHLVMMPASFTRSLLVERRGGIEPWNLTKISPQRGPHGIGNVSKIVRGRALRRHKLAVFSETADLHGRKTGSDLSGVEFEPLCRL